MAMNDPRSWPATTESSTGRMLSTGPVRPRWTKRNTAYACGAENGPVRFELKEHYASEEAARFAIEA